MRLLKQIIEKKMQRYDELRLEREYPKAIWQFYQAFNLSVSYLNKEQTKDDIIIRNKFWKKLCSVEEFNRKKLNNFLILLAKDHAVVFEALRKIERSIHDEDYSIGDGIYKNIKDFAVLAYELPDLE